MSGEMLMNRVYLPMIVQTQIGLRTVGGDETDTTIS